MVAKTVLFVFVMLFLPLQKCDAQDQKGRVEAFFALGRHFVLNDHIDPRVETPDSDGYMSVHLLYNFTETQSVGVRYGGADYSGLPHRVGENYVLEGVRYSAWVKDLYATYRYSWRKRKPLRIYFEAGLGASGAIRPYDTGVKFALSFAVGLRRFIGQHWSLGLESRGVGFIQEQYLPPGSREDANVTIAANEFTAILGYMF